MTLVLDSATHDLVALHRAHRAALEPRLTALGVNYGAELAVETIGDRKALSMTELATSLGVTQPSVTKVVGALERGGVVTRLTDDADGRVSRLELTASGRRLRAAIRKAWEDAERETLAGLSAGERAELRDLLGRALRRRGLGRPGGSVRT